MIFGEESAIVEAIFTYRIDSMIPLVRMCIFHSRTMFNYFMDRKI